MDRDQEFLTYGDCRIDPTATICRGAVVGKPYRPLLQEASDGVESSTATIIGTRTYVGHYAIVGSGSALGSNVIIDDFCHIESDVAIDTGCLVIYRAQICNEARIGAHCVIGGFVAERVRIGVGVRIFGKIVHSQRDPTIGWDAPEAEEGSALIEDRVFIGFDALVVGGISIGKEAYVCAGAIVTRDVPARHVASDVNRIRPFDEWRGPLAGSRLFRG